ncbi:MAG: hypothetical protein IKR50_06195, partial [Prevotella sp.]|nr:hypothetical protein [Prevotella sp.]
PAMPRSPASDSFTPKTIGVSAATTLFLLHHYNPKKRTVCAERHYVFEMLCHKDSKVYSPHSVFSIFQGGVWL